MSIKGLPEMLENLGAMHVAADAERLEDQDLQNGYDLEGLVAKYEQGMTPDKDFLEYFRRHGVMFREAFSRVTAGIALGRLGVNNEEAEAIAGAIEEKSVIVQVAIAKECRSVIEEKNAGMQLRKLLEDQGVVIP